MVKRKITQKQIKKVECQNCGTTNSVKAKFCHNCGVALEIKPIFTKQNVEGNLSEKKEPKPIIHKHPEHGTVIFGKFKLRFFIIIGILIVAIMLGFIFLSSNGNLGSNGPTKFAACTSDSQCPSGSYCSNFGACLVSTCGDGICTSQEKQNGSCPIDCGCSSGYIVNKYLNVCQAPVNVSASVMRTYISNYLKNNSITGTITAFNNTYYGNRTVEEAFVNCQVNATSYPCQVIFYFNQNGAIINVIRTS